jgi:hypothetical protein
VEPCRDFVIGSRKGIDHGQDHGILGENERASHKKPLKVIPI